MCIAHLGINFLAKRGGGSTICICLQLSVHLVHARKTRLPVYGPIFNLQQGPIKDSDERWLRPSFLSLYLLPSLNKVKLPKSI